MNKSLCEPVHQRHVVLTVMVRTDTSCPYFQRLFSGSFKTTTGTDSLQRCLAIAWLLLMANRLLQADDWSQGPSRNITIPRIFKPGPTQFFSLPDSSPKSTFDLKASITSEGDFVKIPAPIGDDAMVVDEAQVMDVRRSSDIVRVQYSEPMEPPQDEQLESTFPPQPSGSKPLTSEAVPLDGALRDEDRIIEDDHKPTYYGSYNSLGWIAGTNDRLGIVELDSKPSSRVWFDPTQPNLTNIDVEWGVKWLSGPNITDLPPQLFNILFNIGQRFDVDDRLTIDAMISPGWFTDFSNKGVQAFRLPWHLVSYYKMDPDWHWVLGVTDLSRDDIQYLPVIGTVYAPVEGNVRLDLVFPKPRIAWKIREGSEGNFVDTRNEFKGGKTRSWKIDPLWLTLGGELGGGSYAVSRSDRAYDVVTYRDYRLIAGLEAKSDDGRATRLEAGWIFDRSVQYRSGVGNYDPTDSFMIRVSTDY